jgi:mono/diheme cytochrome c family protein
VSRLPRPLAFSTVAVLAAAGLLIGCVSAVPRVDDGLVQSARDGLVDADAARLQAGYEAYRGRCSGCHQLVPPGEQQVGAWSTVVNDHRERLELTDTEAALIVIYLQAGRLVAEKKATPANPPAADTTPTR